MFFTGKKTYSENSLDSLLEACAGGNARAQKALIGMFYGYAKSISLRYAGSEEEAEEILNDGFLKVFKNLHRYEPVQPFKAWLRTLFTNTAIDYYRKNLKYSLHVHDDDFDLDDENEYILSHISAKEILGMIQKLPDSYRIAFTMYAVDGYSHKEIADMLGIREGTSKSNVRDARKKLQAMMKQLYPDVYQSYESKKRLP